MLLQRDTWSQIWDISSWWYVQFGDLAILLLDFTCCRLGLVLTI